MSRDRMGDRPAIVLAALADSRNHGRDPSDYLTGELSAALAAAKTGHPRSIRRADEQLSRAFLRWAHDLDVPRGAPPIETDRGAAMPEFNPEAALRAVAIADDLSAHLANLQQRHPFYNALASALRAELAAGRNGELLAINLERARALPASPVGKHVVVDAATARLWMFDGARQIGSMKVVVGRPEMPTPLMSGVIRYVVVEPYWNVPVDIVRDSIAPVVLRQGTGVIDDRDLEILTDWAPDATPVTATAIDWRAVADGKKMLRVRQRPGPGNMMGRIKFMLPNDLGIYLHDTPKVSDFNKAQRAKSSGCVRVENAPQLAAWLFDGKSPLIQKGPDRSIALPRAVPVYISYFTVAPVHDQPSKTADIYGRDGGYATGF